MNLDRFVSGCKVKMLADERTALFIDGPNVFACAKSLDLEIDFRRLLEHFRAQGRLIRALYYTPVQEDQELNSIRPLIDWLEYNGFTLVTKRMKEFTDTNGRRRRVGNTNIELAIDAFKLAPHLDHLVLFTGNGDFRSLVEAVQCLGKRVSVISTLKTQPAMVADELRRQADHFIDLAELEPIIGRDNSS